jgi:sugar/nucleoside kinase (ribokinase family)
MAATTGGVTVIGCVQADVLMGPVTELPPAGGTLLAEQMSIRVGGAGANAALSFVEAGVPARLIGCIGDDQLGHWMSEELAPAGLADELVVVPGQPTGLTVALESDRRDRTFLTYLGVNADWGPDMIPADALRCDELLFCDYFVAPGLQGDGARGLLASAQEDGARTYFDTAWDPEGFPEATRAEIRRLLPWVDVFVPNEAEACALAGVAPGDPGAAPAAARTLQAASGGWVVVKLGARGCLAAGPDGAELAVPAPATSVADTTGAGDTFNAGLVRALAGGASWADALAAATRFASEIISRPSNERYRIGTP